MLLLWTSCSAVFFFEGNLNCWGIYEEFTLSSENNHVNTSLSRPNLRFLKEDVQGLQKSQDTFIDHFSLRVRTDAWTVLNSWGEKIGSSRIQALQSESGVSLKNPYLILFIYDLRTDSESYLGTVIQMSNFLFGECRQVSWGVAQLLRNKKMDVVVPWKNPWKFIK